MSDLEECLLLINENRSIADFVGPRDEQHISMAEERLALRFPPTYRRFVQELGAGGIGSLEFCGLTNNTDFDHARWPNVVWVTLQNRLVTNMPATMIVFYNDGMGSDYVLDTAQTVESGEAPVYAWYGGLSKLDDTLEYISSDFGAAALKLVRHTLSRRDRT